MCGITGVFGSEEPKIIAPMLRCLSHRGPDDEFLVHGKKFTLGARRLSIIGLKNGRQPINSDKIWAAQNGEIYNYKELKLELEKKGYKFKTDTDTEVIIHGYKEYGKNFVKKTNGMFAFSIWDEEKEEGLLIRDRIGKKPLYYTKYNNKLYFSSEIKSLLKIPGFKKEINYEALYHYLSYKNVPCPLSIFKGINQVKPGHILSFNTNTKEINLRGYWSPEINKINYDRTEEETKEQLIELLKKAIKKRLISDVPVGFFLSGGLDSSLVVALAAQMSEKKIKTFTLIYPQKYAFLGKKEDEKYARDISKRYNTEHHEKEIDFEDFTNEIPKIIQHFDEPFGGVISTYFLSKLISKHVKVVMAGDGADELFGSYLTHRLAQPLQKFFLSENYISEDIEKLKVKLEQIKKEGKIRDWEWRHEFFVYTDNEKEKLFTEETKEKIKNFSTKENFRAHFEDIDIEDPLNRILGVEFKSLLPDQIMTFVDRLSMAHSLEVRAPYLDHEFVDFAFTIPGEMKIKKESLKNILKIAAEEYLPREAIYRKKEGFIMPINNWLFDYLKEDVKKVLSDKNLKKHKIFNQDYINKMINDFYNGKKDLANKIFLIYIFQIWYNLYMD